MEKPKKNLVKMATAFHDEFIYIESILIIDWRS